MKLDRLTSTTRQISHEAAERARAAAADNHRRVEAAEGIDPDRERSAQQELAAAAETSVPTEGQAQQVAKGVAAKILDLGSTATRLLKPAAGSPPPAVVDTRA